jgi:ubiquinone/menaquinone biosynthesis C-methylase UbiE
MNQQATFFEIAEISYPSGDAPDVASSTDAYALRFSGPAGTWLLERQTAAIAKLMAPWSGGSSGVSVLDVGGGHAQVTPPLKAAGHDVTTLVSCQEASERLMRVTACTAHVITGDLSAPPLPDASVDVAISVRMMAHVDDWEQFLAGLCRVAREAVIIDFPIASGFNALAPLLFGAKKRIEKDTRCFRNIPMSEVTRVLAENGFRADAHVGQFVLPMALHRALKRPGLSRALEWLVSPLAPRFGNPVILRARREAP